MCRQSSFGKFAATFVDTHTRLAVRISPRAEARYRAVFYAPEAASRCHAQRDGYQCMPNRELLKATTVELLAPLEAILSQPGVRVSCARCGEEIMNEREVTVDGQMMCRGCAGE